MFDAGDGLTDAQRAVGSVRDGVDDMLGADLPRLSDDQLLSVVRELEVERRRLASVDAALLAEIDMRGLAYANSCNSTANFVSNLLSIDPAEASGRVKASAELAARHTLGGETVPPAFEHVAAAVRGGDISSVHARIITRTIDRLPADVQAQLGTQIEAELVDHARHYRPRQLRVICRRMHDLYDQDGRLASDADRERRRCVNYRMRADGSVYGDFDLEPVTGQAFLSAVDSIVAAVSADERGKRTPAQLRHDALRDLLLLALRAGTLTTTGGVVATILLVMTAQQLAHLAARPEQREHSSLGENDDGDRVHGDGMVQTGHGALIGLESLRPLLGDAQILPLVLSRTRRVEAYGDKHRIFTENQRLAMTARDLGCSFPGCTVGPSWTEAHHVVPWSEGGRTTVDNGTLVCPTHHRHFSDNGWECVMRDGVPHWLPPAWIDPERRPQRNAVHAPGSDALPTRTEIGTSVLSSAGTDPPIGR